ncbi:MAG: 3D domain-containing protein [Bdellovibrionales bacterium]|nr:3D domain-containing protein [Bdellovibrionales bacterium]
MSVFVCSSLFLSSCTGKRLTTIDYPSKEHPSNEQKAQKQKFPKPKEKVVRVTKRCIDALVSAYTSSRRETDSHPRLTADGTRLNDSSRVVAVSRDLEQKGFVFGLPVTIEGLPGTYRIADRTNRRFNNRVDLYMGMDRTRALKWGVRRKEVCLFVKKDRG